MDKIGRTGTYWSRNWRWTGGGFVRVMQVPVDLCAQRQLEAPSACASAACQAVVEVVLPNMLPTSSGQLNALRRQSRLQCISMWPPRFRHQEAFQ